MSDEERRFMESRIFFTIAHRSCLQSVLRHSFVHHLSRIFMDLDALATSFGDLTHGQKRKKKKKKEEGRRLVAITFYAFFFFFCCCSI